MTIEFAESDLARLRARDMRGLEACYRAFEAAVRRLARTLLGGAEDADDATQEIFLKVYERASQFEGGARFSTWLYKVAVNHCLNRMAHRERRAHEPLAEDYVSHRSEDHLRAAEAREDAERLLARLDPEQRLVIVLREIEGLDYREMAEVLGVPIGTVMSRLHRARKRLIESLLAERSGVGSHE